MTFEEVWKSGEHISRSIFKEEGEVLYNEVMKLPEESTILEIGAYVGRSTHVLATTAKLKNSKVITIDPFLPAFDGWHNSDPKTAFLKNVLSKFDNVKLIEKYSHDPDARKQVRSVDFMFIDGDHSYQGVDNDCKYYLPKLKSGCSVSFHDYHNVGSFPGTTQAVDEHTQGWHVVNNVWSITTRQKP